VFHSVFQLYIIASCKPNLFLKLVEPFNRSPAIPRRDVDSLTEQVDSLTEQVDSLTEQVDSLTEQVDSLTEQVDSLTEQVDSLIEFSQAGPVYRARPVTVGSVAHSKVSQTM
jgi:uncharacterized protein YlxW (UPF0749 family)